MATNAELEQQLRILTERMNSQGGDVEVPENLIVRVSTFQKDSTEQPKVILSWKSVVDDVQVMNGNVIADQQTEITLEDEQKVKLKLVDFYRLVKKVEVSINMEKSKVTEKETHDGLSVKILDMAVFSLNGNEYSIDKQFLN